MPTIADNIIDALGGTTAVSRKAEAPLSTVHSWRKNGIPSSRLAHLKLIASSEGVEIDWATGLLVEQVATDIDVAPVAKGGTIHNRSTSVAGAAA